MLTASHIVTALSATATRFNRPSDSGIVGARPVDGALGCSLNANFGSSIRFGSAVPHMYYGSRLSAKLKPE